MSAFVEYEGRVHLMSPTQAGEFTLCGDAFDAYSSEDAPELQFKTTSKRVVTCRKCAAIIEACRGVKTHT